MQDHLDIFEALADPTRIKILELLSDQGELCVCHIFEALGMSQPRVSRHLAVLRSAKMVRSRREGRWIHYSLAPARLDSAGNALRQTVETAITSNAQVNEKRRAHIPVDDCSPSSQLIS